MSTRTEFQLTPEQKAKLLEAMKPVPYIMVGGSWPTSRQENANDAWKALGEELGFDWKSVQPVPGKSDDWFSANLTNPPEFGNDPYVTGEL